MCELNRKVAIAQMEKATKSMARTFRRNVVLAAALVVGVSPVLFPTSAAAWGGTEHIRFPDQAYQFLNIMRRGDFYAAHARALDPVGAAQGKYPPLTQCPPSADCAPGGLGAGS